MNNDYFASRTQELTVLPALRKLMKDELGAAMKIDHALLTRFNLPSGGREQRIRLEEGWLVDRWELFITHCAPTVTAQTNQNFSWIIYFDPESPGWLKDKAGHLADSGLFTPIYRATVGRDELFTDVARATGGKGDFVITTNLDNDDGLALDFVDRVQRATQNDTAHAIYLIHGLILRGQKLYRRVDRNNAFCSVSESWEQPQGCWSKWHNLLADEFPVIEISGAPGWLQVIHGRNVSNRVRGRLASPSRFASNFSSVLDELPEPNRAAQLYDMTVQNMGRNLYESGRAITKSLAVRMFGQHGMADVRNKLEQNLLRARTSIQSNTDMK